MLKATECSLPAMAAMAIMMLTGAFASERPEALVAPQRTTVWDSVYAASQADRGRTAYKENCASCHGIESFGGAAPALRGDVFFLDWADDNLGSLFEKIRSTMPPRSRASSLGDGTYVDIVALLLQLNGFPAGLAELPADAAALRGIQIEGKEGPGFVPNFAMIEVLGCLERGPGSDWILTGSTEPVRTRNPDASADAVLKSLQAKPAGVLTFRLLSVFPSPDSHVGHKMEAKGLLIRAPDDQRINVTSLTMVASSCRP